MALFNNYGGVGQNPFMQPMTPPTPTNYSPVYNYSPTMGNIGAKNFIFATEEEMKAYILPPNGQMFGLDKTNGVLRVKTTDGMGNVTMEAYKLSLVDESKPKATEVKESKYLTSDDIKNLVTKDDLKGIVTRDEFDKLAKRYSNIESLIKGVQNGKGSGSGKTE